MPEKVGSLPHMTTDMLMPYLLMASTALGSVKLLFPHQQQVVNVINKLQAVIQNQSFSELMVFLVNTFGENEPSQSELAQALSEFGHKVTAGESPPKVSVSL
jgi:hypothetical protein